EAPEGGEGSSGGADGGALAGRGLTGDPQSGGPPTPRRHHAQKQGRAPTLYPAAFFDGGAGGAALRGDRRDGRGDKPCCRKGRRRVGRYRIRTAAGGDPFGVRGPTQRTAHPRRFATE